jgi:hypothetical protein
MAADPNTTRQEAEQEADEFLAAQAALHDPDGVAGGYAALVYNVGRRSINSSIGAQWPHRVDAMQGTVEDFMEEHRVPQDHFGEVQMNVAIVLAGVNASP